ncbi:hypothetical protein [Yinghuangia sp. YIM S09857]|uniref:hypothetical protein n=1 Tax=Yinghuangia sp. YIM S09857 TaxID=3436929 RepID=UPI003F52B390
MQVIDGGRWFYAQEIIPHTDVILVGDVERTIRHSSYVRPLPAVLLPAYRLTKFVAISWEGLETPLILAAEHRLSVRRMCMTHTCDEPSTRTVAVESLTRKGVVSRIDYCEGCAVKRWNRRSVLSRYLGSVRIDTPHRRCGFRYGSYRCPELAEPSGVCPKHNTL